MALTSETANVQVCVRNTFIDLADVTEDEHGLKKRRSSSLPRNMKLFEKESPADDEPLLLKCGEPGSDSEAACAATPSNIGSSCETYSDGGDSTEASSGGLPAEDFPEPPAVEVPRQRTKLKVSSAVWRPSMPVCRQDPISQEIYDAISAISKQLMAGGWISDFNIMDIGKGFEVRVALRNEPQVQCMERSLSAVKQSLLSWAETSASNIYVLGYCSKPFLPLADGHGFIATLSPVAPHRKDSDATCWESYKWGSCSRAPCRWKHPTRLVPVKMRVDIELPTYQGYCMDMNNKCYLSAA